jgi:hypothetical protein
MHESCEKWKGSKNEDQMYYCDAYEVNCVYLYCCEGLIAEGGKEDKVIGVVFP